jgi:hypothetical protein
MNQRPDTWPFVAIAIAVLTGCGPAGEPEDPSQPLAVADPPMGLVHPTGGWLEHERSPLIPFCHAVLIAPDVVVTSSRCADDGWDELSFGVGEAGSASTPVVAAWRHPLAAEDPRHALIALRLESPISGVEPAQLATPEEPPCGVELPTYQVALRGEEGARRIWTACGLDAEGEPDGVLVAMEGYPNCHGDSGAGAFVPGDRDRVIGWVTGAGFLGPRHPEHEVCVTSVELATVAANREFLDEARARSRVSL